MLRDGVAGLARAFFYAGAASVVSTLSARGRSRKDGFPTVGAVCDRPHFVNSRKKARSQTAPTIDTANSADFCHGLLEPNGPNVVARLKNGSGEKRPLRIMAQRDVVNVDPKKGT